MKIEVLDKMMGTGKTTGIIKWMNTNPQNKYLVISPMLSEVEERFPDECGILHMTYPTSENTTKGDNLLELLKAGRNISITHKLFSELRKEHLKYIKDHQYVLVIDEEINFISPYTDYSASDLKSLLEKGFISVDEEDMGRVHWNWDIEDKHKFSKLKQLSEIGCVYITKSSLCAFVLHLPVDLITSASRVILLTYGYEGSIMESFMSLKGIQSTTFDEISLMKDEDEVKRNIKSLIKLVDTPSTKKISKWNLSSNWYDTASVDRKDTLKKAIVSFKKYTKVNSEEFMFCTKKSFADKVKSTALSVDKSFVYGSCRGTNDYRHKTVLFHAYNRYPNLAVGVYLKDYGHPCDSDRFALYEMLQWIWRSAIRDGKGIQLCIVSERMRELFVDWLDSL